MEEIQEVWKDIIGCEGYYQVSNLGRAKSLDRQFTNKIGVVVTFPSKMLKLSKNRYGYICVNLSVNGRKWIFNMHRAIAIAFIPNPLNKPQVNHINGVKVDNRIENLEWCTSSENRVHAMKIGLSKIIGIDSHRAKLTNEQVLKIREMALQGISRRKIVKEIGTVGAWTIWEIIKRRTWKHI